MQILLTLKHRWAEIFALLAALRESRTLFDLLLE